MQVSFDPSVVELYAKIWDQFKAFGRTVGHNRIADEIQEAKVLSEIGVIPPQLIEKFSEVKFSVLGGGAFPDGTKDEILAITLWTAFLTIYDDVFENLTLDLQHQAISQLEQAFESDGEITVATEFKRSYILFFYFKSLCKSLFPDDDSFLNWWSNLCHHTINYLEKGATQIQQTVSISDYCESRKYDSAGFTFFVFAEIPHKLEKWISDQEELQIALGEASLILGLINDIFSFPKEVAKQSIEGNLIHKVMVEKNMKMKEAIEFCLDLYNKKIEIFLRNKQELLKKAKSWEKKDREVLERYVDWVENIVETTLKYHKESMRYVKPLQMLRGKL